MEDRPWWNLQTGERLTWEEMIDQDYPLRSMTSDEISEDRGHVEAILEEHTGSSESVEWAVELSWLWQVSEDKGPSSVLLERRFHELEKRARELDENVKPSDPRQVWARRVLRAILTIRSLETISP